MVIVWNPEQIEFYSLDDVDTPKEIELNNYTEESDLLELWKFISDKIIEFDEKWSKECEHCWEQKEYKMFDIDWTNLEELLVCNWCWDWKPYVQAN